MGKRKFDFVLTCFLANLTLLAGTLSHFLDIDELKTIHYDIDIRDQPVVFGRPLHTEVVYLSSKFGQRYECQLPDVSDVGKVQEEEKTAAKMGISDLLKPMENLPCLRKTKDWWTYEFCYGKHVQQFHMENNQKTSETITLGIFESEMNWENTTHSDAKRHRLNRYHSHKYVNGSTCDLTGKPREVEVRFLCAENEFDTMSRIDEPESCRYVITVHTLRICHHPYLKPLTRTKPKTILCFPLLTADQYDEFIHQQIINKYSKEAQEMDADGMEEKEEENDETMDEMGGKGDEQQAGDVDDAEEGGSLELLEEHHLKDSSSDDASTITVMMEGGDNIDLDADVMVVDSDQFADVLSGVLSRVRDTLKHINDEIATSDGKPAGTGDSESNKVKKDIESEESPQTPDKDSGEDKKILVEDDIKMKEDEKKDVTKMEEQKDKKDQLEKEDGTEEKEDQKEVKEEEEDKEEDKVLELKREGMKEEEKGKKKEEIKTKEEIVKDLMEKAEEEGKTHSKRQDEDQDIYEEDDDAEIAELMKKDYRELMEEMKEHATRNPETADMILELTDEIKTTFEDLEEMDRLLKELENLGTGDGPLSDTPSRILQGNTASESERGNVEAEDGDLGHRGSDDDSNEDSEPSVVKEIAEGGEEEVEDGEEAEKKKRDLEQHLLETLNELIAQLKSKKEALSPGSKAGKVLSSQGENLNSRVRVRVTRVKLDKDNKALSQQELKFYDTDHQDIEEAISDHLEKSGVNVQGMGEFELRVLSYVPDDWPDQGTEEAGFAVLSEEESNYFRNMIFGLATRNDQDERVRQDRLLKNYGFQWSMTSQQDQDQDQTRLGLEDQDLREVQILIPAVGVKESSKKGKASNGMSHPEN